MLLSVLAICSRTSQSTESVYKIAYYCITAARCTEEGSQRFLGYVYLSMKFAQIMLKAHNLCDVDRAALYNTSLKYLKPVHDILVLSLKANRSKTR